MGIYNDLTRYNYHKIDTADIWLYERIYYREVNSDWTHLSELYELIQEVVMESMQVPSGEIGPELHEPTEDKLKYYNLVDEKKFVLGYFFRGDKWYDLDIPCLLKKNIPEPRRYRFFFALKLRQYTSDISYVADFLAFHLETTFEKHFDSFKEFLELVLLQHSNLLADNIIDSVTVWVLKTKDVEIEKQRKNEIETQSKSAELAKPEFIPATNPDMEDNRQEIVQTMSIGLPQTEETALVKKRDNDFQNADPNYVKGFFNDSETQHYFEFLYKAKDKDGEAYLPKEVVDLMFREGIKIPSQITTSYKLNLGGGRNKKMILWAIYNFFDNHSSKRADKQRILTFFASYLKDFAFALHSENAMNAWSKNITADKPKKPFFELSDYIPVRLSNTFHIREGNGKSLKIKREGYTQQPSSVKNQTR